MTRIAPWAVSLLVLLLAPGLRGQTEDEALEAEDEFLDPDEAWHEEPPAEGSGLAPAWEPTGTFDHGAWTDVLGRHVGEDGRVDYRAWLDDPAALADLDAYLASLAAADPAGLADQERVAFWINAYNACAVRVVLDSYPLASPRAVADFFDAPRCAVPGNQSLNDIETVQLGTFSPDPRYHFALVPAAMSAPPLLREAYSGPELEAQLAEQTTRFIRATTRVMPNLMQVELSRLFDWFGDDFERFGGIRTFVAAHLDDQPAALVQAESTMLVYPEFDWRLNDAQ